MALEDKPQALLPSPAAGKAQDYRIAVVRIDAGLKGSQGLTHIRLALLPHQLLNAGYEGCFFLTQHFQEPVYFYAGTYDYPIARTNEPAFCREIDRFRHWGKLIDDPRAGLASKDADERLLTAALLISQYRTYQAGLHRPDRKTEPIDAKESQRILEVLAAADWAKAGPDFRTSPSQLFAQLGASAADGWAPQGCRDPKGYETQARNWLRDHAGTFRIQALVRA
jgi:hypothetical protein